MSTAVKIGDIIIGGGAPVAVQSMLNMHKSDVEGNVRQAAELEKRAAKLFACRFPTKNLLRLYPQ